MSPPGVAHEHLKLGKRISCPPSDGRPRKAKNSQVVSAILHRVEHEPTPQHSIPTESSGHDDRDGVPCFLYIPYSLTVFLYFVKSVFHVFQGQIFITLIEARTEKTRNGHDLGVVIPA